MRKRFPSANDLFSIERVIKNVSRKRLLTSLETQFLITSENGKQVMSTKGKGLSKVNEEKYSNRMFFFIF